MTHAPISVTRPTSSANGMKAARCEETLIGVLPANQRFGTLDLAVNKANVWLEVEDEFVAD